MPAHFAILTASTQPPQPREVARKVAGMTLLVSLIGVVVITVLTLIVMRRMRRRLTDAGRARRTRHSDAWAEAGRRAGSPPAEAFEADTPVLPGTDPGASPGTGPAPGSGPGSEPDGRPGSHLDPSSDKPGGPYG